MSFVWQFTTLDDAFFFLNQLKAMTPAIPSSRPLQQRYIRACILFSWLALEEALDVVTKQKYMQAKLAGPLPRQLGDKLEVVLHALGKPHSPDEFMTLRKVRNDLVHPNLQTDEATLLTQDQAARAFGYCSKTIQRLCPVGVEVVWG